MIRNRIRQIGAVLALISGAAFAGALSDQAPQCPGYCVQGSGASVGGDSALCRAMRRTCAACRIPPEGPSVGPAWAVESGSVPPEVVRRLLRSVLPPDWNPQGSRGATDRVVDDIFRGAVDAPVKVGRVRYWDAAQQQCVQGDDANPLVRGWRFWVLRYGGGHTPEFGPLQQAPGPWTQMLQVGWNLYAPSYSVTVPAGSGMLAVWRWDSAANAYELVPPGKKLLPGEGYWVLKPTR